MESITSVAELKAAIRRMEEDRNSKGEDIRHQFDTLCGQLKPANILNKTFRSLFTHSESQGSFTGTSLGVAAGLFFRNLFVGSSDNIFKKFIGSFLQFGITDFIAKNSDIIGNVIHGLLDRLLRKRAEDNEDDSAGED